MAQGKQCIDERTYSVLDYTVDLLLLRLKLRSRSEHSFAYFALWLLIVPFH